MLVCTYIQIILAGILSVAILTLILLSVFDWSFVMHCLVSFVVSFLDEGLASVSTFIIDLVLVHFEMVNQVPSLLEHFATVWILAYVQLSVLFRFVWVWDDFVRMPFQY